MGQAISGNSTSLAKRFTSKRGSTLKALSSSAGLIHLLAPRLAVVVGKGGKIVPQSEKYVVERFGRLSAVLGPGINLIVPFIDHVAHRISILERQLPAMSQDAITADNVLVQVESSVFFRILHPEKTVYRIRDVDEAIATTVAGIWKPLSTAGTPCSRTASTLSC